MARNDKRKVNLDKTSSGAGQPKPAGTPRESKESKSEARQRAAQLAQEQARARKRRLLLVQAVIGVAVIAIVAAITVLVLRNRDGGTVSAEDTPPGLTSSGGFTVGNPDAPVTVEMIEDFQCPVCKQFEATNADLLSQYAAGDDVKLVYRGIAFLDRMSSTDYSSRALNASACVMPQGEQVWTAFHRALYEQQPPEQGDGLPDSELIDIATTAGADASAITSCIDDDTYGDWVKATTDQTTGGDFQGTPTILVNGTELSGFDTDTITAAVDKALGK